MPRIRSIKPDFFISEDVSSLPLRARLTWIGLWTHCDDHGRTKDNGRLIKAALWALDEVSLTDVEKDLAQLHDAGRILRYEVNGKPLLAVVNWHAHQSINRPGRARHEAPPKAVNTTDPEAPGYCRECALGSPSGLTDDSVSPHGGLTPGKEGKGGEGRGARARTDDEPAPPSRASPEPPRKCSKHLTTAEPPPCRACGDARREHEAWKAAKNVAVLPSQPMCPTHPDQPTGSRECELCASEAVAAPDLRALAARQRADSEEAKAS